MSFDEINIPTKEELKAKYEISTDDFEILTELPREADVRKKGFLLKVGEALGVQEWMWKTWAGVILAIIFVLPTIDTDVSYWKPKAIFASQQFYEYFQHLNLPLPPDDTKWIAFTPDVDIPPSGTQVLSLIDLPIGSGIYPSSGHAPFA